MPRRNPMYYCVNPTFTAGSPAQVDEATARRVVAQETQGFERACSGIYGEATAAGARLRETVGIVYAWTEKGQRRRRRRPYDGRVPDLSPSFRSGARTRGCARRSSTGLSSVQRTSKRPSTPKSAECAASVTTSMTGARRIASSARAGIPGGPANGLHWSNKNLGDPDVVEKMRKPVATGGFHGDARSHGVKVAKTANLRPNVLETSEDENRRMLGGSR